jgi:aspartate beta-hydroxylase
MSDLRAGQGSASQRDAARRAMAAADFATAAALLQDITARAHASTADWLSLAAACRAMGDGDGAMAAVEGALRLDPRAFMALLMQASLLERAGRLREAAPIYGRAILQAPPESSFDPATRRALAHGRAVNQAYGEELAAFLRSGAQGERGGSPEARRVDAFIDYMLGRRKRYHQEPLGYFYPGLPAIEFWDREEFPWLATLEAASDVIKAELAGVLRADHGEFEPYIDYRDSQPLDQWLTLNRSPRWSGYHLLKEGRPVQAHAALCPTTLDVLAQIPQPVTPNRSPSAMFSALAARTHIPPHTGVSNTRLVCHLPLIVPDGCRFRVGNELRTYTNGQAWVFDDTIEHEAFNDSDETRIILLFDVWNPRLSPWEREMIATVSGLYDEFNGVAPAGQGL